MPIRIVDGSPKKIKEVTDETLSSFPPKTVNAVTAPVKKIYFVENELLTEVKICH